MDKQTLTVFSEAQAAQKPALGAPCNGCGVCCLMEPCPLGRLLCGSRGGPCAALRWQSTGLVYRCGAITDATEVLRERLPKAGRIGAAPLGWLLERLAPRWVAAGVGCDCEVDTVTPAHDPGAA